MSHNENANENNQSTDESTCQTLIEGANVCANFPPDPMGSVQVRQEQLPVNFNSFADFSPSVSSKFGTFSTSPIFNFAPPPTEFPLQLKILHILMAHVGSGEHKEKVTCRLQSPSAVARGHLGFVVEHELGPFNRTGNIFTDHRFRDLERRSQASVSEFGSKFIELAPPPPMNTLTLLCLASDRLQMDPQMTIEMARKLNKIGLISSPLTNGDKYSAGFPRKEMIATIVLHLDELCGLRLNAQEILLNFVRPIHRVGSAEPIHPVLVDHKEPKYRRALDENQLARRLYELVCCYFLATCMCPGKIAEMTIKFSVGPETFKSVKHTVVVQGFLLVVPWMRPDYRDTELPIEATKQQNQFIKQTFIVSDVRRLQIENPKGGLSEAKLISQMALLELGNYGTIPETLSKLVQKKLANVVGPGRWIVPTSEGLQKLETFRRDGFETDCDNEQASDTNVFEDLNENNSNTEVFRPIEKTARKRVRFDLPVAASERLRSRSMGPMRRQMPDTEEDRYSFNRYRRAPSPELAHTDNFEYDFPATEHSHRPSSQWTPINQLSVQDFDKQQRSVHFPARSQEIYSAQRHLHFGKENSQKSPYYSNRGERSEFEEAKIFIGNLSPRIDVNNLVEIFRTFGKLRKAEMVPWKRLAFVEFAHSSEAERAVSKMNGKEVDGYILKVEKKRQFRWHAEYPENRANFTQSFNAPHKFAYAAHKRESHQAEVSSPDIWQSDRVTVFDKRSTVQVFPPNGDSISSNPYHRHFHTLSSNVLSPHKRSRFDDHPSFGLPPASSTSFRQSSRAPFRDSHHSQSHRQEILFSPPVHPSSPPFRPSPVRRSSSSHHSLSLSPNDGYFFFRR